MKIVDSINPPSLPILAELEGGDAFLWNDEFLIKLAYSRQDGSLVYTAFDPSDGCLVDVSVDRKVIPLPNAKYQY